jgi:hypothetical protein
VDLVNVAPIPEMEALFPITGFFAVAFTTQRLTPVTAAAGDHM